MTERSRGGTETEHATEPGVLPGAADLELIDQFLTDRLNSEERAMVETRIVADPAFRREVELTEALRAGMRELSRLGEIAPLLTPPPSFWNRPPIAVAASVVAGLLIVISFLLYDRLDHERQQPVGATEGQSQIALMAPHSTQILLFEHTRSSDLMPDVTWRRSRTPTLLELRFDIGLEPADQYTATIELISNGSAMPILVLPNLAVQSNGQVLVTIHPALLQRGDYHIRLEPQSNPEIGVEPLDYSLRISD